MLYLIPLLAGFAPLILGANWLVDGSASLAQKANIPTIVIGLTVVAFGTSTPEFVVNVFAAANGTTELALGNVLGSNIVNIFFILGISALIYPIAVKRNTVWVEIPYSLLAAVLLALCANDALLDGRNFSELSRIDGLVFLGFFVIFMYYTYNLMKQGRSEEEVEIKNYSVRKSVIFIVFGIAGLIIGGRLIVFGGVEVARRIGLGERFIGLTIVSVGTSLPELVTSIAAARKRNTDIAVGNVVGSNIFNTFLILGVSAVITPISLQKGAAADLLVNILSSLLLFVFVFLGKRRTLNRWEGCVFVTVYVLYMLYLISGYTVLHEALL